MASRPFSRLATVMVPFSLTSGSTQFDMIAGGIPMNADGTVVDALTFGFVNMTPYDVVLKGFPVGKPFTPATMMNADWIIQARSEKGLFLSKKPVVVSVTAVSTPGNPIPSGADFTGCFLAMPYGRGV